MFLLETGGSFLLETGGLFLLEYETAEEVRVEITYDDVPGSIANGTIIVFEDAVQDGDTQTLVLHVKNISAEELTISIQSPGSPFEILSYPSTIGVGETEDITIRSSTFVPGELLKYITIDNFVVQLAITIVATDAVYTTRADLERVFGKRNVALWADLNGTEEDLEIDQVIYKAILDASRDIDSFLSAGSWTLPFVEPIPPKIAEIACLKAGTTLYTSRGMYVESFDRLTATQAKIAYSWLEDIRRGKILLNKERRVSNSSAPIVV